MCVYLYVCVGGCLVAIKKCIGLRMVKEYVCVCVCVCVRACVRACVCVCLQVEIEIFQLKMCFNVGVCVYESKCIIINVLARACVFVCMFVCVREWVLCLCENVSVYVCAYLQWFEHCLCVCRI